MCCCSCFLYFLHTSLPNTVINFVNNSLFNLNEMCTFLCWVSQFTCYLFIYLNPLQLYSNTTLLFPFQIRHSQIGSHIKRILTIRTDWFGVCVLLRIDIGHPIYGYVVPSIRNNFTYFGCNRIEFLFQQKN